MRTPIDAFLLAKLEDKGLSFSPEPDYRTLVRRLFFDLTGLPPTPEEADVFVKKHAARPQAALEAVVDKLLAEASRIVDLKKRGDLYRQVQKLVVDDAPTVRGLLAKAARDGSLIGSRNPDAQASLVVSALTGASMIPLSRPARLKETIAELERSLGLT